MVSVLVAGLLSMTLHADTVVVLGAAVRDLTGDRRAETLRVVGRGRTVDSLAVTFTIESSGVVIYELHLSPITRFVGFGRGGRARSQAEYDNLLEYYRTAFFADSKFTSPQGFEAWLSRSAPARVAEIPLVLGHDRRRQMARDSLTSLGVRPEETETRVASLRGRAADSISGRVTWDAIRGESLTVFQFPLGGDGLTAIAWSPADRRFYRLLECC